MLHDMTHSKKLSQLLQSDSHSYANRQTDKSKDQSPKQHQFGRRNNLAGYRCPIYFFRIGPELCLVG